MSDFLNSLSATGGDKSATDWTAEVSKVGDEIAKQEAAPPQADPVTTPDAQNQAAVAPTQQQEEEKRVPLKALQEARAEAAEMKRRIAELEHAFQSSRQPVEDEQDEYEIPDPEKDPIGALKYNNMQLQALRETEQARAQEAQLSSIYQQSAQQFAAQEPSFKAAYNHAIQSRANELMSLGYQANEVNQMIRSEELQVVATALQRGINPAKAIFDFATARGFQRPAAAPAPVGAPAATPSVDPAIQKAKADAATSLTGGGKPPANEMTVDDAVKNLKGAALDSYLDKHWKAMETSSGRNSSLFRS